MSRTRILSKRIRIRKTTHLYPIHAQIRSQSDESSQPPALTLQDRLIQRHGPQNLVASENFNRWLMVPPAVLIHLSIGSVYGWSVLNAPLSCELGAVMSSASDWTFGQLLPVMSTAFAMQGIMAAIFGTWQEKVGARINGSLGAFCFGGGFMIGGLGVAMHNLPLLYFGYGFMAGSGIGIAYVPPLAALIRWFPDRRGMATGMAIMGFGGAAMVATPILEALLTKYSQPPTCLGAVDTLNLITKDGSRFADVDGKLMEVVVPSAGDIKNSQFPDLAANSAYIVGTGKTGVAETLGIMGAAYFANMLTCAWAIRTPPDGWKPEGYEPPAGDTSNVTGLTANEALKTPQFWCLWGTFACVSTTGMGVISIAKTMMSDIFAGALPLVVTGAFASTYVVMISAFNLGGRIFWASISDKIGRQTTFTVFTALGIPFFLVIPSTVGWVTETASMAPLVTFYASTMLIFSFFGGTYSTLPAYEADIFGAKYVGSIHGRMLTASSVAALAGPVALSQLRANSESNAIYALADKIDPAAFANAFGAPKSELDALVESKSATIKSLLELCPEGTSDPTPYLYDSTMYTMAGLMGVAALLNRAVKPLK